MLYQAHETNKVLNYNFNRGVIKLNIPQQQKYFFSPPPVFSQYGKKLEKLFSILFIFSTFHTFYPPPPPPLSFSRGYRAELKKKPVLPFTFCNQVSLDDLEKIPGQFGDRRTMLGELNWIFTAITDTIAWNTLPRETFQKLFRQDLLVASLFR